MGATLKETIAIEENGIYFVFGITGDKQLKLLHFSSLPYRPETLEKHIWYKGSDETFLQEGYQLVQVSFSGYNRPYEKHGNKHIVTAPGYLLKYVDRKDERTEEGRRLTFIQEDEKTGALVTTYIQFFDGLSIVRTWSEVKNNGSEIQTLEYISSFCYTGIEKEGNKNFDDKLELTFAHNGWQKEMSFRTYTFSELGFAFTQPTVYQRTSKTIELTNTGNWSTKEYLPMGYLDNTETNNALYWQIEHNGSWHTEIGDQNGHIYLNLSGPTEVQSHWFKNLQPEETFTSVPAAIGVMADKNKNIRFDVSEENDNEKVA